MDLVEALAGSPVSETVQRDKPGIPKPGDPGTYEWNGTEGVVNTQPTEDKVSSWDAYLVDAGLDPDEVEVIEPVQVRGWDANKRVWNPDIEDFESSTVRMHYYRLNVRRKSGTLKSLDEVLEVFKGYKTPRRVPTGESAFVVAIGDLQIGKMDGDGPEGTVRRALDGLQTAAETLKAIRGYKEVGPVHIAFLGDCIEGFVSQNGANAWRTVLTVTEQIRALRRIMVEALILFAPLTDDLTMLAVPGNHDQAIRFGKSGVTTYDDSFDTEALLSVKDACALAEPKFDHVTFVTPERDELAICLEIAGTKLGHIHGHQTKARQHFTWWAKQSLGDQQIGEADVLLAGHFHHFMIDTSGKRKFIQVPALESESTWYRHQAGETGDPGILTFVTLDGRISNIEIL